MKHTNAQIALAFKRRKQNAAKRGMDWSITIDQFETLYNRDYCEYTGIKLVYCNDESEQNNKPDNLWSLDRIDSKLGYVWGNVVQCSVLSNLLKGRFIDAGWIQKEKDKKELTISQAQMLSKIAYKMAQIEGYKMVNREKKKWIETLSEKEELIKQMGETLLRLRQKNELLTNEKKAVINFSMFVIIVLAIALLRNIILH